MKKSRSTKELLILVRANIEQWFKESYREDVDIGICHVISELQERDLISFEEYALLNNYLKANLTRNAKNRREKINSILGLYWWIPGRIKPRIKWLDKQILKLK